jgi:hypothetical protein
VPAKFVLLEREAKGAADKPGADDRDLANGQGNLVIG